MTARLGLLATLAVVAEVRTAAADDALAVGAAVGAGGQGTASYGAVELRLDAEWHGARLGLGARGVWQGGAFRASDWDRARRIVTIIRVFEARTEHLAVAAGGLAPSTLDHVADGERAALDDHLRTGARGAITTAPVTASVEIDDVIDPALVGGAIAWRLDAPWTLHAAAAVDPGTRSAIELAGARRWDAKARRAEAGAGIVGEPTAGVAAVAFATAAIDRAGARWTATADVRAGTGTLGGAFGPLYRLERTRGITEHAGVGAGTTLGVTTPAAWASLGVRERASGLVATMSAGAPMSRFVQAAMWAAASRHDAAGAAELRIAWAPRLSSALQLARMVDPDVMSPVPAWSVTAWFAATTE